MKVINSHLKITPFMVTMRNIIMLVCGITSSILFGGCKKYPEGGHLFSFTNTEKRVVGSYHITGLTVNGNDTSMTGNSCMCAEADIRFARETSDNLKVVKSLCCTFPKNDWYITNDRRQLIITYIYTTSAEELYPIAINDNISITWTIQRLTRNEVWLKTNLNMREYHLKLRHFQ
jgi:hypothetical protein